MKDEIKVSKNREKKQQIVASLVEKMQKAKAIVFTNYQGLTHKQLEDLKKHLKTMGSDFVVAKNSLILLSAKDADVKIKDEKAIEGPTGTMFIYEDIVAPLKQLAKVIKELGLPSVKIGFLENQELSADQILKLATLPSREVLLAQLVGVLKGPIYGLHRGLSWNIQKLAIALSEVAKAKPTQTAIPASTTEPTPVSAVSTKEPVETSVVETADESVQAENRPETTEKPKEDKNEEEVN